LFGVNTCAIPILRTRDTLVKMTLRDFVSTRVD
jgi:hypothetical protein